MKKMYIKSMIVLGVCAVFAPLASALPTIDLSSWSELTLDFPGGQAAGNWVLGGGNTSVTQLVNADPSF